MSDKLPIPNISSDRIMIRYAEDGGAEKDNIIEIRPGVEDLTLYGHTYAQVRIMINDKHYLKGMAIYATNPDDFPNGVDLIFNTSKSKDSLESIFYNCVRRDPLQPFDKLCRQWSYQDTEGNSHVSPLNIVNDDTDWDNWAQKTKVGTLTLNYFGDRKIDLASFK